MLQKRYNDFLPYLSPAKNRDSRIKNDMEFVPAILFVRENSDNLVDHMEFGDTNWHFYAQVTQVTLRKLTTLVHMIQQI